MYYSFASPIDRTLRHLKIIEEDSPFAQERIKLGMSKAKLDLLSKRPIVIDPSREYSLVYNGAELVGGTCNPAKLSVSQAIDGKPEGFTLHVSY